MSELIVTVSDIRAGDVFHDERGRIQWTALEDAEVQPDGRIVLTVRYADGGRGERVWAAADADWQLAVVRA